MLQFLLFLLPVAGAAGVSPWSVNYSRPICAARGSNVTVACNFTFPQVNTPVKEVKWCSMNSNYDKCLFGPYVYDSEANNNSIRFQYIGDNASDCSLLINDIQLTDSGEYKFRFITSSGGLWTGHPGVIISVYDLKVSKSNSIINGAITGDSVNLTCSLDCPGNLSEVQWFKNGELMKQTNPILILNGLPAENSGNYSCSLRKFTNPLSGESVSVFKALLIIVVSSVSLVFIIIVAVILMRRRKAKTQKNPKEVREGTRVSDDNIGQATEAVDELKEDEVLYTSVTVKAKEADVKPQEQTSANTEQQNESIYSGVKTA
ncbi:sialoadhesin [Danio aesculapii]|uniref:sialoadhesin n=1 Tax=Danio aesculapii TaxID=1142201 RepID=UPI0024C0CD7C|nr:sialoadhesin [Danio aesculapii]